MDYWRMSFRQGTGGRDMWRACLERGVAALGIYLLPDRKPVVGDCSELTPAGFDAIWRESGVRNHSMYVALRDLRFAVMPGDVVYARSSPYIVGKGTVTTGYRWDPDLLSDTGCRWEHYLEVDWREFAKPFGVTIQPVQYTLLKLEGHKLQKMLDAEAMWQDVEALADSTRVTVLRDLETIQLEEEYVEGQKTTRLVSYYERNPNLRAAATAIHGTRCQACGMTFVERYGELGEGFIEVHHLKPVADYGGEVSVNPETDMAVVCPNCHRMIHRRKDKQLTVEKLRGLLEARGMLTE